MRGSITIEGCIATGGSVFIESYFTRRGHDSVSFYSIAGDALGSSATSSYSYAFMTE